MTSYFFVLKTQSSSYSKASDRGEACEKSKGIPAVIGGNTCGSIAAVKLVGLCDFRTGALPQGPVITVLATVLICAAVFMGGVSAALFTGEKGALMGAACGLFFACCVAAIAFLSVGASIGIGGGGRLAAIFFSGCIGGVLGVNRKQRVKF